MVQKVRLLSDVHGCRSRDFGLHYDHLSMQPDRLWVGQDNVWRQMHWPASIRSMAFDAKHLPRRSDSCFTVTISMEIAYILWKQNWPYNVICSRQHVSKRKTRYLWLDWHVVSGTVSATVRMAFFFKKPVFTDTTCKRSTAQCVHSGPVLIDWMIGTSVSLMQWTLIEPGVYLIAACLPTLRPLWSYLNPRTWSRAMPANAGKDVPRSSPATDRNARFRKLDGIPLEEWSASDSKLTADVSGARDPPCPWEDMEASIPPPKSTFSGNYSGRSFLESWYLLELVLLMFKQLFPAASGGARSLEHRWYYYKRTHLSNDSYEKLMKKKAKPNIILLSILGKYATMWTPRSLFLILLMLGRSCMKTSYERGYFRISSSLLSIHTILDFRY